MPQACNRRASPSRSRGSATDRGTFSPQRPQLLQVDVTLDVHQREDAAAHLDDLDDICGQTCAADGQTHAFATPSMPRIQPPRNRDDSSVNLKMPLAAPSGQQIYFWYLQNTTKPPNSNSVRLVSDIEHDLALESRSHGIERIEFLAEQLARREREIEDRRAARTSPRSSLSTMLPDGTSTCRCSFFRRGPSIRRRCPADRGSRRKVC